MYLYYKIQGLKRYFDTLSDKSKNVFDLTHLVLDEKPSIELMFLPLKESLELYESRDAGIQKLKEIESLKDNEDVFKLFPISGDDFELVEGNYSRDDIIANLDKFKFDGSIKKMNFDNSPWVNKESIRYCCTETIGTNEERIADVFKMLEVLLLWITNKLTDDQKQQVITKLSIIDASKDLVVSKKYAEPTDFISVFLEREKKARKVLDRKY